MPRLSDNTLLHRAIPCAVLDRESFADCYGGEGPEADEAKAIANWIQALQAKHIDKLVGDEIQAAFSAFLYAEQWQQSLAEAQAVVKEKKEAQKLADLFREVRIRRWGKTALEVSMETATLSVIMPGGRLEPMSNKR